MDGEAAKGLCAAEFEALMRSLMAEAEAYRCEHPEAFPLGYIVISLDNAKPHMRWRRAQPSDRLNCIPAGSPDIHKVVEHPLKPFNDRWYREFTLDRKCTTARDAMALASDILRRTTADSIDRDMRTLPDTMRSIIKNKGDWADDELC
jgi:hypothetical protein